MLQHVYNIVLPALRKQFGEGLFLLQCDKAAVNKAEQIRKTFSQFGAEEVDRTAQSCDLSLTQNLRPTTVLDVLCITFSWN